jgi:hypothetical protein
VFAGHFLRPLPAAGSQFQQASVSSGVIEEKHSRFVS